MAIVVGACGLSGGAGLFIANAVRGYLTLCMTSDE